jgi:hypothetical protein
MNFSSLNLNPHQKRSKDQRFRAQRPALTASDRDITFGLPDRVPSKCREIVPVDTAQAENAVELLLEVLEHRRPGSIGALAPSRFGGRNVRRGNIGCALRPSGEPVFLPAGARYRLPLRWRWVLDPETDNLLDRVRTDIGTDVTLLNLNGTQVIIAEDGRARRWALSSGLWLLFAPARIVATLPELELDASEPRVTEMRRREGTWLGQVLQIPPLFVAMVQHNATLLALPSGLRVLLDLRASQLLQFLPLKPQFLELSIPVRMADKSKVVLTLSLEWCITEPATFVRQGGAAAPVEVVERRLRALLSLNCSARTCNGVALRFLLELKNALDAQLPDALARMGLTVDALALLDCQTV